MFSLSPGSSVGSVQDLKTGGRSLDPGLAQFLSEDSHCDRINSSPTVDHCFDDDFVRKLPVAWKEYCACTDKEKPGNHRQVHWPPRFHFSAI